MQILGNACVCVCVCVCVCKSDIHLYSFNFIDGSHGCDVDWGMLRCNYTLLLEYCICSSAVMNVLYPK
jgi:hypothetical protein